MSSSEVALGLIRDIRADAGALVSGTLQGIINNHYSRVAVSYDYLMERDRHEISGARRKLMELLEIKEESRVLEIGVGTGVNFLYYPALLGTEYTGMDVNKKMLEEAQARLSYLGVKRKGSLPKIRCLAGDAAHLDFPDNYFDRAIATFALSAIPENEKAFSELERVVKPGGRIGLFEFEYTSNRHSPFCGVAALNLRELLSNRRNSSVLSYQSIVTDEYNTPLAAKSIYILEVGNKN